MGYELTQQATAPRPPRSAHSQAGPATRLSTHLLSLFEEVECDPESCRISAEELRRGLSRLGLPCAPTLVDEIFAAADHNSDGMLDYGELLKYATEREAEVARTFARIARNGRIKPDEMKGALFEMGLQVSDEQAAGFFAALDREHTGRITLQEFERFCWLLPRVNVRAAFECWVRNTPLDSGQEPGMSALLEDPMAQPDEPLVGRPAGPPSPGIILASGALAGVVSRTATAPLDRLKVLMQVGHHTVSSVDGSVAKLGPVRHIVSRSSSGGIAGVLSGLRAIYQSGGVAGFFQGNGANVVKIVPESAIKFWVYDWVKRVGCRDYAHPTTAERLVSGAAAGAASCIAIYPLEVAKTRMAVARAGEYVGIRNCLQQTARAEGRRALYKGLPASLIGIIPFSAVDLCLFNTLKERISRRRRKDPDVLTLLGCGALSASVAQVVTYPLALAKTKLQAAGMPGHPARYTGLVDCLRQTVRDGGPRALYHGLLPNLLKAVPAISISYVVFETTKKTLTLKLYPGRPQEQYNS